MDAYRSFRRPFIASEVSKSQSVTEWLTQNGTNSTIKRLKARRAKGIKWSEDEALADSERMPWYFDDTSSEESSSEDDGDEPAAKRTREK